MMAKKEREFASAKEVIKTYFPTQAEKKTAEQRDGDSSKAKIIVEELATGFGADLRKGLDR